MKFNYKKLIPHLIAIAVFLVASVLFCKPAIEGKVLQQHDIVGATGMAHNAVEYKEKTGHFPLWNTHIFSGMPNYQVAVEGPHILPDFGSILTLGLPKPINFFFLACLCFYLLCITFRINPFVAIFSSLAFAFCTYDPVIIAAGHETKMMAIAYAPGLLAGLVLLYERRYWTGLAATAFFASMEIAANHPQINYYLFIIIFFMTLTYLFIWIKNKEWKHMAIALSLALVCGMIGISNAAVTFLTTAEYTKYTMRGGKNIETTEDGKVTEKKTQGLDPSYALSYSIRKSEIFTLAMANAFGGSSGETFVDNNTLIENLTDKNIPEANAGQISSQLPKYWGGIVEGTAGPVYIGAITFLLCVIGFTVIKKQHRIWIGASILLAFMMAWGKYFEGFNDILLNYLPMYNKFRAPSMILVIPQILIPLGSAFCLQNLLFIIRTVPETKKISRNILYSIAAFIGIAVIVYLFNDYHSEIDKTVMEQAGAETGRILVSGMMAARKVMFGSELIQLSIFTVVLITLLFLFKRKILTPIIILSVLTLINSIDLMATGKKYLNDESYIDTDEYTGANFTPSPFDQQILKDTDPHFRIYALGSDRFLSSPTTARMMYYHRPIGGYHPAKLRLYQDLIESQLSTPELNMGVLNMLDTRYFLIPDEKGNIANLRKNDSALGGAWFVKNIKVVNGPAEEMKSLDNFNPAETAFIDKAQKAQLAQLNFDTTDKIVLSKYDNDLIEYVSDAKSQQFAVFSEIYYPAGWNAYVDDNKTDYYKVNYLLRGMPIPAGHHIIRFKFEPASYKIAYNIALSGGIVLYLVLIIGLYFTYHKKIYK
ncbi:YfhO family protein [soil metagenome]